MNAKQVYKPFRIAVIVSLASGFLTGCGKKQEEVPVKVGVILNLTGESTVDASKKKALELANEYEREKAGGSKIELVFEDGMSTAKDNLAAYNKLARQGIRVFMVGDSLSAMPLCPVNKEAGNLMFAVSGHPDFTAAGGFTIRCHPTVEQGASIIAGKLIPASTKTIYILHMEEPWTKSYADAIRRKLGDKVKVLQDPYPVGGQNFEDIVARIKNAKPDQIILLDNGPSMQAIVKTLMENQLRTPIIGCETSISGNLPSVAGFDLNSFVFLATDYAEEAAAGRNAFANWYKTVQGEFPRYSAVYLADALAILSNVLADNPKVAGNPEALHAAIIKRGNWSAFSGRLVVKPTGDVDYPIGVYRFENGLAVRLSNLN